MTTRTAKERATVSYKSRQAARPNFEHIVDMNFTLGHLVGVIFSTQNPTDSKLDTVECLYQEAKLDAYDPDI